MNFNALLQILSYFFNPKRWAARREEKKLNEIRKWEDILARALKNNDTRMISVAGYMLKELREKNKING